MLTIDPTQLKVAVLAGGTSGEREISIASGAGACTALREAGFNPETLDPARKDDLKALLDGSFDVAFLCLHGKGGEDGVIQGFLECAGVPYTGSGVLASAVAMDKSKSKPFYRAAGLDVPDSVTVHRGEVDDIRAACDAVGFPCVVKPACEGSALGVFVVREREEYEGAIARAFEVADVLVVERYVTGVEVTAAVIGNEDLVALPVIEIVPFHEFYDFESKYAPGGSKHICPARLSIEQAERVKRDAIRAHCALGCSGVSRTDFIVDRAGVPWVLETNTIPGMTSASLLPDAARAAGMDFSTLCTRLIELALEKGQID